MPGVLLDTDVVSFLFRNDPAAKAYARHLRGKIWTISFMTLAEIEQGMLHRRWGKSKTRRMEEHLLLFAVYWPDPDLCRLWAWVRETRERKGKPISTNDAWIAATALRLDLPLVTNNAEDYQGIMGLKVTRKARRWVGGTSMKIGIHKKRNGFNAIELVVVVLVVFILIGLGLVILKIQRDNERRIAGDGFGGQTLNKLKQLALACHNANDVFKRIPPAFDKFGQITFPASIHVHLLPFIDQDDLYKKYLEEEGKGEASTSAIVLPFISYQDFTATNDRGVQNLAANLRAFSDKGMATNFEAHMPALAGIEPGKASFPTSFPDGTGNTILFTTKYVNCQNGGSRYFAAPNSPFAAFFGQNAATSTAHPSDRRATYQVQPSAKQCLTSPLMAQSMSKYALAVGMADGSVRMVDPSISPRTWNLAVQPNDGMQLEDDW
jgi:tRNA(fMet)-specific endonuclease VapC